MRVEPAHDGDVEVRTQRAVARRRIDAAVELRRKGNANAARARAELHVGFDRKRSDADVDVAVSSARAHTSARGTNKNSAIARADVHGPVRSRGGNLGARPLDGDRAVARPHTKARRAREEHRELDARTDVVRTARAA